MLTQLLVDTKEFGKKSLQPRRLQMVVARTQPVLLLPTLYTRPVVNRRILGLPAGKVFQGALRVKLKSVSSFTVSKSLGVVLGLGQQRGAIRNRKPMVVPLGAVDVLREKPLS